MKKINYLLSDIFLDNSLNFFLNILKIKQITTSKKITTINHNGIPNI